MRIISVVVFLVACNGGGGSGGDDSSGGGSGMSWDVDGTHYVANGAVVANDGSDGSGTIGAAVQGTDTSMHKIALGVIGASVDTFPTGPDVSILYGDGNLMWQADGHGGSGMIVITVLTDHEIAGTFEGDVMPRNATTGPDRQITNGVFDVSF
ncbi:MAG TPA: hypothetical protein VGM88_06980 [Kofleriaceae bacterium]|jgi:hypothetical protein